MVKIKRSLIGYFHFCPGCKEVHHYRTYSRQPNGPLWVFNGDEQSPSFTPSMLIRWGTYADPNYKPEPDWADLSGVCHYFLTDGKINFLGDSTHALAGQTVDLPDWPHAKGTYGGVEE